MKILHRLEHSADFWFLVGTSLIFFLLRLPSLFEPYWYGDEGITQAVGMVIQNGGLLYQDVWDNKPPLYYLIFAFFHSDQQLIRLFSLVIGMATSISFFFLAKMFFQKQKLIYGASVIFAILLATPILEGNIANGENFMLLPSIVAGALIVRTTLGNQKNMPVLLLTSGFLLSITWMIKANGVFDFVAFAVFIILTAKTLKETVQKLIPLFVGFIAPIVLISLYFFFKGAFADYFTAVLGQNIGYVGYGNRFIIGQGLLLLKTILLLGFTVFLYVRKKTFSMITLFILIWTGFATYNAFFSQRSYTHYVLLLLPAYVLLFFHLLNKANAQRREKMLLALSFLFVSFVVFDFFSPQNRLGRILPYYHNFISFVTGQKHIDRYRAFFDRNVPRDYQIASYIRLNAKEDDKIFVWGNTAQLYKMLEKVPPARFTVAYHAVQSKERLRETENAITRSNPRFIVVTTSAYPLPYSLASYTQRITIRNAIIYERTD